MSSEHSTNPLIALSGAIAGLVSSAAPFLVGVRSKNGRASGFVWKSGLVVAADEALAEEGDIIIHYRGEDRSARVVGRDAATDVALLRVEGLTASVAALSDAIPATGSLALVVGAPEGAPEAALGVVATTGGAWRSMRGGDISARLELGVSARKTSEGGLAVDAEGRNLGMVVFGPRRRALVIPTATIERVAGLLETRGRVPRGYLGLGLQRVRVDGQGGGVIAMSVDAHGPAAAAGVLQGDIIVALDGAPIAGVKALMPALGPASVGSTVTLSLRRAGAPAEAKVTVGERRAD